MLGSTYSYFFKIDNLNYKIIYMKYISHTIIIYNNIMKYNENTFKREVLKAGKCIYIHTAIRLHAYQHTDIYFLIYIYRIP